MASTRPASTSAARRAAVPPQAPGSSPRPHNAPAPAAATTTWFSTSTCTWLSVLPQVQVATAAAATGRWRNPPAPASCERGLENARRCARWESCAGTPAPAPSPMPPAKYGSGRLGDLRLKSPSGHARPAPLGSPPANTCKLGSSPLRVPGGDLGAALVALSAARSLRLASACLTISSTGGSSSCRGNSDRIDRHDAHRPPARGPPCRCG